MTTLLKAQLRSSLKSVPTVEAQDAVSAALGSMLANQQAAARACAENPQSRSYGAMGDFLANLRAQVERPRPIGYEDEPELTSLPDDEGDDEDEDHSPLVNDELTEEQARAAYHFEEYGNGDL